MNEWMKWMNGRMNECMNEWMKGSMNEWNEQMNEGTNEWMNGRMNGMNEWNEWTNESTQPIAIHHSFINATSSYSSQLYPRNQFFGFCWFCYFEFIYIYRTVGREFEICLPTVWYIRQSAIGYLRRRKFHEKHQWDLEIGVPSLAWKIYPLMRQMCSFET